MLINGMNVKSGRKVVYHRELGLWFRVREEVTRLPRSAGALFRFNLKFEILSRSCIQYNFVNHVRGLYFGENLYRIGRGVIGVGREKPFFCFHCADNQQHSKVLYFGAIET